MVKKLITFLLSVMMVVSVIPMAVSAENTCDHILTQATVDNLPDEFWREDSHSRDEYQAGNPAFVDAMLPAGCETTGWILDKTENTGFCLECGELVKDGVIISATDLEPIPATGHNHEYVDGIEPTCTEGATLKCINVNYELEKTYTHGVYQAKLVSIPCNNTKTVGALGHDWDTVVDETPATCESEGTRTITKTCNRCGAKETKTETLNKIPHDWSDWTVINDAKCGVKGEKKRRCNSCGLIDYAEIPALEHQYEVSFHQDGDCGLGTKTVTVYVCKLCANSYRVEEDAPDHVLTNEVVTKEVTCDKDGLMEGDCVNCGKHVLRVIKATGHKFEQKEIKQPTCTEEGYKLEVCSVCGVERKVDIVEALGHDWSSWVRTEPKCEIEGKDVRTCLRCAEPDEKVIPALEHIPGVWEVETPPNCVNIGEEVRKCTLCGKVLYSRDIPAEGHAYDITDHKDPTCTEAGYDVYTCEKCGNVYISPIKALGHNFDDSAVTIPATCVSGNKFSGVCTRCHELIETEDEARDYSIEFKEPDGYDKADFRRVASGEEDVFMVTFANSSTGKAYDGTPTNFDVLKRIAHTGHKYEVTYTKATCEMDGYWTLTCTREGCPDPDAETAENEIVKVINSNTAFGHDWHLLDDDSCKAPTCTEEGVRCYMCLNDHSHTYTEKIPAIGHTYTFVEYVASTCTEEGYNFYTCDVCGTEYKEYVTAKIPHNYVVTDRVSATCTTEGYEVYTCKACEDEYTKVTTPAKGHEYAITGTISATCDKEGYDIYTCKNCDATYNKTTTPAKGHQFTETNYVAPTCDKQGVRTFTCVNCPKEYCSYEAALGHNYGHIKIVPATCTEKGYTLHSCTNPDCTDSYMTDITDMVPHVLSVAASKDATCNKDGFVTEKCANCDYKVTTQIPATGNHVFSNKVTKAATCTEDGVMTYTCSTCEGEATTYTEVIPAIGHKYGDVKVVEATCTKDGYTTYTCTNPGCTDSYIGDFTAKTSHKFTVIIEKFKATCKYDGKIVRKCATCDLTETEVIKATGEHVYIEKTTTDPTCLNTGIKTFTCGCGQNYTESIPALGHDWKITSKTDASCEIKGSIQYNCSRCNTVKSEIIAELSHKYVSVGYTVIPTCTEPGTEKFICKNCNNSYNKTVAPIGHKVIVLEAVEATCTTDGLTEGSHCSACNQIIIEQTVIKAKGHDFCNWSFLVEQTCKTEGIKTRQCSVCKKNETVYVAKLSHTPEIIKGRAPVCSNSGLTDGKKCAVCGKVILAQKQIPPTGHKTIIVNKLNATYFEYGCKGDTRCAICNVMLKKGVLIPKLKLSIPKIKVVAGKRLFKVKYYKVSGATGFQICYKIGNRKYYKNFKSKNSVTKTIKNLKKGKKCVIKIRAFVKSGYKVAYSSWSSAKSVKVK
ncbi:MAG: hypothetical protein U0L17_00965 [Acutalibacteraceae bacterium]|nr:hypothetical protein [Acutalibacteraceae bacterium]